MSSVISNIAVLVKVACRLSSLLHHLYFRILLLFLNNLEIFNYFIRHQGHVLIDGNIRLVPENSGTKSGYDT